MGEGRGGGGCLTKLRLDRNTVREEKIEHLIEENLNNK